MLSDLAIRKNTTELFDAMRYMDAPRTGGMVVFTTVPVSLTKGGRRVLRAVEYSVRFTHDKNLPKFAIDQLETVGFHTEFSVGWQSFRFDEESKDLVVTGKGDRAPGDYELRLHLDGATVSRNR
jgi:hypothetical protein